MMPVNIWYCYPGNPPEIIDTAPNRAEAKKLLREYRAAYVAGNLGLRKKDV